MNKMLTILLLSTIAIISCDMRSDNIIKSINFKNQGYETAINITFNDDILYKRMLFFQDKNNDEEMTYDEVIVIESRRDDWTYEESDEFLIDCGVELYTNTEYTLIINTYDNNRYKWIINFDNGFGGRIIEPISNGNIIEAIFYWKK